MPAKPLINETCEVEFSEERDYGAVKVRYGLRKTYNLTAEFSLLSAKQGMRDLVYAMFADYEANELPATRQNQYKETIEKGSGDEKWEKALEFRHERKNGKDYYNIRTPRYPKFGVACWEECKGREDMINKLGSKDSIDLDGYRVRVDESGKYPKAVEIDLQF
jgi:hypothetical protein